MTVDVALDGSIAFGGYDGGGGPGFEVGQDRVGVVAFVAEQNLGLWPRLGHDRRVALNVGDLAAGQDHGDRQTQAVAPQMDLGREATARAPKTFALRA